MTGPSSPLARHWTLDPIVDFLNHGSFGACPRPVIEAQQRLRDEMERQPMEFLLRRLPERLDAARNALAAFVGADPQNLAFVSNATSGVNAVLRSLPLRPGDELLVTDHEYNACKNALHFVAERAGATVVVARVPFPLGSAQEVVDAVLGAAGDHTRLALIDHVTSLTGLVLPIAEIVRRLADRGIDVLVDGAHAPGMLELSLDALGAAYYTGNCHKWLCAPKGAALLYVRPDRQDRVRPLCISHGANTRRPGRSLFQDEFDWVGTVDPTAWLCVPVAIEAMASIVPGGWDEVRRRNRVLALQARDILCAGLGIPPPCPDEMIGSLCAVPLPDGPGAAPASALHLDPLQQALLSEHRIEVPVVPWPAPPRRLIRISAQLYNDRAQYQRLAAALGRLPR